MNGVTPVKASTRRPARHTTEANIFFLNLNEILLDQTHIHTFLKSSGGMWPPVPHFPKQAFPVLASRHSSPGVYLGPGVCFLISLTVVFSLGITGYGRRVKSVAKCVPPRAVLFRAESEKSAPSMTNASGFCFPLTVLEHSYTA